MSLRSGARVVFSACLVAAAAGSALGQAKQPPAADPVLKGPSVSDAGVPGEQRRFAGPGGARDRRAGEIPHRLFMRAVDSLRGDGADASVRLSDDQAARIRAINAEFESAAQSFREEHARELKEMVQSLPPEDRRRVAELIGGRPGPVAERIRARDAQAPAPTKSDRPMQEASPQQAEQARARLRELFEQAPKPADAHAKVYAVLNDAQKKAVGESIEKARRELEQGRPRPDQAAKPGEGAQPNLRELLRSLPAEEQERIRAMAPEERRKHLDELAAKARASGKPGQPDKQPARPADAGAPSVREMLRNATAEERENFKNLSPEEKRAFLRQLRERADRK